MTEDIVEVDPKTETISCDGGEDGLGHPAVYYPSIMRIKLFVVIVVKYL